MSEAFNPNTALEGSVPPAFLDGTGVWDTGATGSVVTADIVARLGLRPIDRMVCHTLAGSREADVYLANFKLPNRVVIPVLRVVVGADFGADVLIGMDVIGLGDFAVTTKNDDTWLTFSLPPHRRLDFTRGADRARNRPRARRR